jgi:hypothetical protein
MSSLMARGGRDTGTGPDAAIRGHKGAGFTAMID